MARSARFLQGEGQDCVSANQSQPKSQREPSPKHMKHTGATCITNVALHSGLYGGVLVLYFFPQTSASPDLPTSPKHVQSQNDILFSTYHFRPRAILYHVLRPAKNTFSSPNVLVNLDAGVALTSILRLRAASQSHSLPSPKPTVFHLHPSGSSACPSKRPAYYFHASSPFPTRPAQAFSILHYFFQPN